MQVVSFKKFNQARGKVRESLEPYCPRQLTWSLGLMLYKADPVTKKAWHLGEERKDSHTHYYRRVRADFYGRRGSKTERVPVGTWGGHLEERAFASWVRVQ